MPKVRWDRVAENLTSIPWDLEQAPRMPTLHPQPGRAATGFAVSPAPDSAVTFRMAVFLNFIVPSHQVTHPARLPRGR